MATKSQKVTVNNVDISIYSHNEQDYICLTDMVKAKEGSSRATDVIKN